MENRLSVKELLKSEQLSILRMLIWVEDIIMEGKTQAVMEIANNPNMLC